VIPYFVNQLRKGAFQAPRAAAPELLRVSGVIEGLAALEDPRLLEHGLHLSGLGKPLSLAWAHKFTGPLPESRVVMHRAMRDQEAATRLLLKRVDELRVLEQSEDRVWTREDNR
jgi:hypothetical protein